MKVFRIQHSEDNVGPFQFNYEFGLKSPWYIRHTKYMRDFSSDSYRIGGEGKYLRIAEFLEYLRKEFEEHIYRDDLFCAYPDLSTLFFFFEDDDLVYLEEEGFVFLEMELDVFAASDTQVVFHTDAIVSEKCISAIELVKLRETTDKIILDEI